MLRLLNGAAGRREEGGIAPQMAIVVSSVALGEREMGWGKGGRVRAERRADVGANAEERRTFGVDGEKRRTE